MIMNDCKDKDKNKNHDQMLVQEKLKLGSSLSQWLSHELASPLATIGLMANFLEKQLQQVAWDQQPELSDKTINKMMGVPQLIKDYVNCINTYLRMIRHHYDMVDSQYYPIASLSAVECVNQALKEYPFIEDKWHLIDWNECDDFIFLGNRTLVQYVLLNVLDNAMLAIKKVGNGKLIVSLQSDDEPTICLRNTGSVLAAHCSDELFEPFFTTYENRVGMGLFFCKNAMRVMGGDIRCQPFPNGTIFNLRFKGVSKD